MAEKQVVNKELSKQLEEAGYPQEGLWWWIKLTEEGRFTGLCKEEGLVPSRHAETFASDKNYIEYEYVAPTAAELGIALPEYYATRACISTTGERIYQCWNSSIQKDLNLGYAKTGINEADAKAKMWLWLKKKGYLK